MIPFVSAIAVLVFASSCHLWKFRYSDATILEQYHAVKLYPKIDHFQFEQRNIRYFSLGEDTLPTILMIHGAPSSISVFDKIMRDTLLNHKARIITYDRPGYGFSGLGNSLTSIEKQVEVAAALIDRLVPTKPFMILGVSYGGPIACRLAARYGARAKGLVLGAPALAPGEEQTFQISYPMTWRATRWMFPRMLTVASEEKFAHKAELEKIVPYYCELKVPLIYLQGMNDAVVYPSNATYVQNNFTCLPYLEIDMIPNQKHFLSHPQKDRIVDALLRMLQLSGIEKGG